MKERFIRIFRKLSLVQKFSTAVIFMTILMMITVGVLIIRHQRSALKEEMDNNHRVVVKNLAKDAVEPLILMDPLRLDDLVKTTGQTPGCVYAGVLDQGGRIVAHTDRKRLGRTLSLQDYVADAGGTQRGEEYHRDMSDGIRDILVPVRVGGEVVGTVIAGFSLENSDRVIERNLQKLKNNIFLITGFVMLVGIWGAFSLAKFLAIPIKRLKEKMQLVQAGNLDAEVLIDDTASCTDILNCHIRECPAFGKKRCWTISGTRCYGSVQDKASTKIGLCRNCIVYKASCGDEVGELVEVFNQMVRDLKQNMKQLEEANLEKCRFERLSAHGQIVAGVAHEVRNPLNAILAITDALCQDLGTNPEYHEFLVHIRAQVKRLSVLMTDLLELGKPVEQFSFQPASLEEICSSAIDVWMHSSPDRKHEIKLILPVSHSNTFVTADSQKLQQVFINLLENAAQHTPEGSPIHIVIHKPEDGVCRVEVVDRGSGIEEATIPRIFEPFFSTRRGGVGLGMSIVKHIVEAHEGAVGVENNAPPPGCTIKITFPCTEN